MKFALNDQPIKIDKLSLPTKKVRDSVEKTMIVDFTIEGGNHVLDMFDAELLPMFFKAVDTDEDKMRHQQLQIQELDEQAPMPLLRSVNVRWPVRLTNEYAGYRLVIDHGLGDHVFAGKQDTSNIIIPETTIKGLSISCKEGGAVVVKGRMLARGVSGHDIGRISDFIKLETKVDAEPPQVKQQPIDGTTEAFAKDYPDAQTGDDPLAADLQPRSGDMPAAPAPAKPKGKTAPRPPTRPLTKAQRQAAAREAATAAFVDSVNPASTH